MSLEAMASKGERKLTRKASSMAASYNASKPRAIQHFAAVGFGPNRVSAYTEGINAAEYRAPSPTKWRDNWLAKMRE